MAQLIRRAAAASAQLTPRRKSLLHQLRQKGMRNSPKAEADVRDTLAQLDSGGAPRDVHVYNTLIEVAIFRRKFGTADEVLAEMASQGVAPNSTTLALLLQTFTLSAWQAGEPAKLFKLFRDKYGIERDVKSALIETTSLGRAGMAKECQVAFSRMPALQGHRRAWFAMIEAHARAGNLHEATALLSTMERKGQLPDVAFFNVIFHAGKGNDKFATVVDQLLAKMGEWKIMPNDDTVAALAPEGAVAAAPQDDRDEPVNEEPENEDVFEEPQEVQRTPRGRVAARAQPMRDVDEREPDEEPAATHYVVRRAAKAPTSAIKTAVARPRKRPSKTAATANGGVTRSRD